MKRQIYYEMSNLIKLILNRYTYRDIFLTLNIVHTYSLCSILKNTDQCIVSCYATNYIEHQRF
jgi:hypothetical protein